MVPSGTCRLLPHDDKNSEPTLPLNNQQIAVRLDEIAGLLENQGANVFRVRGYRSAANTLRGLERPAHEILADEGVVGLTCLSGIGESLGADPAACADGPFPASRRPRGHAGPEHLFRTLPGIGLETASRIHEQLGIDSLRGAGSRLRMTVGSARCKAWGPCVQGIREALAGASAVRAPAAAVAVRPRPVESTAGLGIVENGPGIPRASQSGPTASHCP